MAEGLPGWYPDPGGAPGRFRYWDGTAWSPDTTDRPGPAGYPGDGTPRPRRRGLVAALAVIALLVTIAIVAVIIITPRVRPVTDGPLPTSTVSGGDDRSPTSTPTPPPPPGSPTPSNATPVPLVPCPEGDPNLREPHPVDGRVHGGNLSFREEPSFDAAAEEPRFSFAHDVTQQTKNVDETPAWIAQLAVGRLRASDGFVHGAKNTAESVVQCAISSSLYDPYQPSRADRRSQPITIDERKGWLIETDITVADPGLDFAGDRAIFVVVADGQDWGMFFGAVPIGDALLEDVMSRAVRDLRAR